MRSVIRVVSKPATDVILLVCLAASGCQTGKKAEVIAPTQTDRMMQAYPEIQNGRVLILADFEDEGQMALFQVESANKTGQILRDSKKGRSETGSAALAATLAGPADVIVVASPRDGDAFLKRDWRPYDLLLMAVHSPAPGLNLETRIVGGVSGQTVETRTDTTLASGWNYLRFDLAEIGEQVPLDDIREIRLSLDQPAAPPVTLHVDDLLLIGNRRDLMGDSANNAGKLYVQGAGRHWNVGVPGRFEVSFRNGQITRWFNLATDSYRLRNLVRGTSLGPMPVIVEGPGIVGPAMGSRDAVSAQQRILEMNDVRVVVDCVWESNEAGGGERPFERRIYAIYATGQIFVTATTSLPSMESASLAMALNLAWSPNAPTVRVQSGSASGEARVTGLGPPAFALARGLDGDATLLFVPYPDAQGTEIREFADSTSRTTSLLWSKSNNESTRIWRGQILLASSSSLDDSQAFSRAIDYIQPGGIRIEIGAPATSGSLRSDGFDPGTGSYLLGTDGNRVRTVVQGKNRTVFAPAFTIDGGSAGEAWVYVNHLVHPVVIRGQRGELLFQLPDIALKEIVVEALFKK